jgi:hypothetical protein
MNKEEFIDFLDSYSVMMKIDGSKDNKWNWHSYDCDDKGLLRISKGEYKNPRLWVKTQAKGFDAELSIVTGEGFFNGISSSNIFIKLHQLINLDFNNLKKFKFKKINEHAYEIFVKSDYESIRDIFIYSIDQIDKLDSKQRNGY